jgi:UBX domain-containing protein 1
VAKFLANTLSNASRPGNEPSSSAAPTSRFRGSGMTLGGDDTPSQFVPDPQPQSNEAGPSETRILHIWADGFSVEDGPLRRYDDPQNAADLEMIRAGRAPIHLMGVRNDQPVDVQLMKHSENYKAPPKVYKPFSGGGQRLGSPTPGPSGTSSTPSAPSDSPPTSSTANPTEPTIDDSQPVIRLQIRLANGTPLRARFNTSHTIGDVYDFVARASTDARSRPWVIATAMPSKDHTDKSLTLGDVPELKRGGNAVQKWL